MSNVEVPLHLNEPIELYTGPFTLMTKEEPISIEGSLYLVWSPTPEIRLKFDTQYAREVFLCIGETPPFQISGEYFPLINSTFRAMKMRITSAEVEVALSPNHSQQTGLTLNRFSFALPNAILEGKRTPNSSSHRLEIIAGDWTIVLSSRPDDHATVLQNRARLSGNLITYSAELSRTDGSDFSDIDGLTILDHFATVLSFCIGWRTYPVLIEGFDASGRKLRDYWNRPKIDGVFESDRCIEIPDETTLSDLFQGYLNKINHPSWRNEMLRIVSWYLDAKKNSSAEENGIIFSQVALELISWLHFVEDAKVISSEGFDKLSAADRLRLLLYELKTPLSFPTNLVTLIKTTKLGAKFKDGPYLFTEIRNSIIHPRKREQGLRENLRALYEVRQLGLFYLELAILKLLEYRSEFLPRISFSGDRHRSIVPWSPNAGN